MTDYNRMKEIYDEIDILIAGNVTASAPEFEAWKTKTERALIKLFGKDSYEYENFRKTSFSLSFCTPSTPRSSFIQACIRGLKTTKKIFETYLEEFEEESNPFDEGKIEKDYSKVFVVHGHDGELRESVARLLERQNITPIILNEQVNQGKTIIEKFEKYSDVTCAICLFTTDDQGKAKDETEYKKRARQNVVFEAGYFIGKLGRENVILIADESVEIPSDMSGMVYSNRSEWRFSVLKELKAMGFSIDYNKLD